MVVINHPVISEKSSENASVNLKHNYGAWLSTKNTPKGTSRVPKDYFCYLVEIHSLLSEYWTGIGSRIYGSWLVHTYTSMYVWTDGQIALTEYNSLAPLVGDIKTPNGTTVGVGSQSHRSRSLLILEKG